MDEDPFRPPSREPGGSQTGKNPESGGSSTADDELNSERNKTGALAAVDFLQPRDTETGLQPPPAQSSPLMGVSSGDERANITYVPHSPIRIESSPEPDLPALGDLLRGTQPPPPPQQQTSQQPAMRAQSQGPPYKSKPKFPVKPSASRTSSRVPTPGPSSSAGSKRKSDAHDATKMDVDVRSPSPDRRPAKRPRTARPSASRHPNFWHLDGSVVIQVESTLFKLHRSRLAKHSTFFAALFARARKDKGKQKLGGESDADSEVEELVDRGMHEGMLTYVVKETTVADFERLLDLFDDPISHMDGPPPFPVLASILRASTALSFENLRKWALRHFERMWPEDLSAVKDEGIPNASATIALSRACNVPSVRKRAYYELLRTPGFGQSPDDEDEDVQVLDDDGKTVPAEELVPLSHADFVALVKTREALNLAWIQAAASAPTDFRCPLAADNQPLKTPKVERNNKGKEREQEATGSAPTATPAKHVPSTPAGRNSSCISADQAKVDTQWATSIIRAGMFEDYMVDPILGLDQLINVDLRKAGYCRECAQARKTAWKKQKETLWKNLDLWLKL